MKYFFSISYLFALIILSSSCSNSDDDTSSTVVQAARISGGPFIFCIGDNEPNFVGDLSATDGAGDDFTWVVTDQQNFILNIPKTVADTQEINFEEAGTGNCKLWLINFNEPIENLQLDNNLINDLSETERVGLSNALDVVRTDNCSTL